MQDAPRRQIAPLVATALALAYPAAVAAGAWALAGVTAAAALAGCAAVLTRRRSARLRLALAAIAVWLALGFGGAFVLHAHALRGFAWVLIVLYAIPLPLVPWIYAKTFEGPNLRTSARPHDDDGQRSGGEEGQRGPRR